MRPLSGMTQRSDSVFHFSNKQGNWRELDEALNLESERLKQMLALWELKRGSKDIPNRADFDIGELMQFDGRVALIDVEHDPMRFRFRLVGTHITQTLERDSTGQYLDELYSPELLAVAVKSYEFCVERKRPIRAFGHMAHADKDYVRFEAIDMPLSLTGDRVEVILKGTNFPTRTTFQP
jgi:hypothetical protein